MNFLFYLFKRTDRTLNEFSEKIQCALRNYRSIGTYHSSVNHPYHGSFKKGRSDANESSQLRLVERVFNDG